MSMRSSNPPPDLPVLWRRPWWLHAGVAATAWALLVTYGSLIPFEFDGQRVSISVFALSWQSSPLNDLAVNLALYVPLGVLLRLAWGRWWVAALSVVVMSYTLECVQGLSPGRVASWQDVIANGVPGVLGAAAGPWAVSLFRVGVFGLYRKLAGPMTRGLAWLNRIKTKPAVMLAVVAINALLIGIWSTTIASPVRPSSMIAINWLPFNEHFAWSYDKAAMFLGRSLLVYCVIGMVLSVALMRRSQQRPLLAVTAIVAVFVAVLEGLRAYTGQADADITEPIIAIIAVGLVFTTAWLFVHAVRCSCRRKQAVDVEHDRRKRKHNYDFSLH